MAKNKWNKSELIWICANLENGNDMLDPYNFILQDYAYLVHVKTIYNQFIINFLYLELGRLENFKK